MTGKADRKTIWGWMMYDWAAQPYATLLLTFIFAPYFTAVVVGDAVRGQALWGYMLALVGISLAILAPVLGAIADASGPRKPWIVLFSLFFVTGAGALWWAVPDMDSVIWVLLAFAVGFLGMEFSQAFVNAMLPTLGSKSEISRISGSGWALGYLGGLVALAIILVTAEGETGATILGRPPPFGLDPEMRQGTRLVGPLTAVWYMIFMIPFFMLVPDTARKAKSDGAILKALRDLRTTLRNLPQNISLAAYLGSSMFYRDALNGIYAFGAIYAGGVLGWGVTKIGLFGIVALIAGALFAWLGGYVERALGPKPVITWCVLILIGVSVLIIGMSRGAVFGFPLSPNSTLPDTLFMVCGAVMGAAGGVLQAASRSMMVRQADPDRMTEAFGLYALSGRATSFLAPFAIAVVTQATGNQRLGLLPIIILFLIALGMLTWVKPMNDEG